MYIYSASKTNDDEGSYGSGGGVNDTKINDVTNTEGASIHADEAGMCVCLMQCACVSARNPDHY